MTTLSQLLSLPELKLRLIQAAPEDPEITWLSVTELLNLGTYLDGGEVILTTGLALANNDTRWLDFVASLSKARIAAIGFGTDITHPHIPPPLLQAASAYQMALFEVPLPTPFIAVGKAVAALLRADELRTTRQALHTQQQLLDKAQNYRDPAEIIATIAQATDTQLALIRSDGTTLASTAGFTQAHTTHGSDHIHLDRNASISLAIANNTTLTPEAHSIIAAGSMVLGLNLQENNTNTTRERELWERLTTALLESTTPPNTLTILDPREHLGQRVRAIAVQGNAEHVAQWRRRPRTGLDRLIAPSTTTPHTPGLAQAWQLCPDNETALDRALAAAAWHSLDTVIGRATKPDEAILSRRSAHPHLQELSKTAPLYTAPRVPEIIWADRESAILEALLELENEREHLNTHPNTSNHTQTDPTKKAMLSVQALGPLSHHTQQLTPTERNTLRATLHALFEADGQKGPAAAQLRIHRNTLRERISRIERLTHRSLTNPDHRAELWYALRLEELRHPNIKKPENHTPKPHTPRTTPTQHTHPRNQPA